MILQCQNLGKDSVRLCECGVAALVLCRSCPPHSEGLPPLCLHQPHASPLPASRDGRSVDKLSSRGQWHVTVAFSDLSHHLPKPVWREADAALREARDGPGIMYTGRSLCMQRCFLNPRPYDVACCYFGELQDLPEPTCLPRGTTDPEHKHIPKLLWPLAQINPPTPPCSHHPCPQKLTLSLDHRHISCHSELCDPCTSTRLLQGCEMRIQVTFRH